MTAPIAPGRPGFSPSPPGETGLRPVSRSMNWGDSALTAPTTPEKRLPVVDRSQVDPQTLKAAEGMEAMFLDYMMKVMRQTVPKNDMDLESPATEIYRSLHDSEVAQKAARAGGVGLADQIVAYLEGQRYTLGRRPVASPSQVRVDDPTAPSRRTGGTNEGQPVGK